MADDPSLREVEQILQRVEARLEGYRKAGASANPLEVEGDQKLREELLLLGRFLRQHGSPSSASPPSP